MSQYDVHMYYATPKQHSKLILWKKLSNINQGWIEKKGCLQKSMYCFWCPASIYLFEFSNTNCKIKCEICLKLAIEVPDVVRKSLLLTLNIFDRLF